MTGQVFGLRARFYLGDIGALTERVPVLLAYADERDDRYAAATLGGTTGGT